MIWTWVLLGCKRSCCYWTISAQLERRGLHYRLLVSVQYTGPQLGRSWAWFWSSGYPVLSGTPVTSYHVLIWLCCCMCLCPAGGVSQSSRGDGRALVHTRANVFDVDPSMDKRSATDIFAGIISYHFHIGKCPIFVTNTIRNGAVIDNTSAKYGGNLLPFDNIINPPVSSLTL